MEVRLPAAHGISFSTRFKELGCSLSNKVDSFITTVAICDDALVLSPHKEEVVRFIKELGEEFDITEEGDNCDYLDSRSSRPKVASSCTNHNLLTASCPTSQDASTHH
jgi:hypothetical protein